MLFCNIYFTNLGGLFEYEQNFGLCDSWSVALLNTN